MGQKQSSGPVPTGHLRKKTTWSPDAFPSIKPIDPAHFWKVLEGRKVQWTFQQDQWPCLQPGCFREFKTMLGCNKHIRHVHSKVQASVPEQPYELKRLANIAENSKVMERIMGGSFINMAPPPHTPLRTARRRSLRSYVPNGVQ